MTACRKQPWENRCIKVVPLFLLLLIQQCKINPRNQQHQTSDQAHGLEVDTVVKDTEAATEAQEETVEDIEVGIMDTGVAVEDNTD